MLNRDKSGVRRPRRSLVAMATALGLIVSALALHGDRANANATSRSVTTTATVKADCHITSSSSLAATAVVKHGMMQSISLAQFNPVQVACTKGTQALLTIPAPSSNLYGPNGKSTLNIVSWVSSSSNSGSAGSVPSAGQFVAQQKVASCPPVPSVAAVSSLGDTVPLSFGVASCMPAGQSGDDSPYTGNISVTVVF